MECSESHTCSKCGGCLFMPCKETANGIHPEVSIPSTVESKGNSLGIYK